MNAKEKNRIQAALESISDRKYKDMGEHYLAFMGAIGALEFALNDGEGDLGFQINNAEYVLVEREDIDEILFTPITKPKPKPKPKPKRKQGLTNLKERIAKKELTMYELAQTFLRLRDEHKMSGTKIADTLGLKKSFVNRLMRCITKSPEYVIEAWSNPDNPNHGAATIENMERVIMLTGMEAAQKSYWREFTSEREFTK